MSKEEIRLQLQNVLEIESVPYWNHLDQVYSEPAIFIGDEYAAKDIDTLRQLGITHVLNAAYVPSRTHYHSYGIVNTDHDWYAVRNFNCEFLGVESLDYPQFDLSRFFEDAADFIDSACCSKGKVLVHCYVGMSRSATLVIAYLMIKKHMLAIDALAHIREKRAVYPNSGFVDQIIDLELRLRSLSS
ncbi:Dual specificity phosphatase DUPD1 [Orchesella cincta]|uniref:protein-serine/threonine phosphatase n=1 Tax=Orchesella cincta TaxID=48709 RepID=A0A1D2NLI9_ORCCI|nr:Dual specificity phosphatase DUPD1 [Orchesella cincta]